jgi:hypothetical protein
MTNVPRFLFENIDPSVPQQAEKEVLHGRASCLLRLFVMFFYDDFKSWQKTTRSIGGGYLTLGNLPRHLRNLLGNIIPIHFGPPVQQKASMLAIPKHQNTKTPLPHTILGRSSSRYHGTFRAPAAPLRTGGSQAEVESWSGIPGHWWVRYLTRTRIHTHTYIHTHAYTNTHTHTRTH